MTTPTTLVSVLVLALFVGTGSALAAPINITVDAAGNLLNTTGVASKAQYGQNNNNASSNLAFLDAMIANYNGAKDPNVPVPPGSLALEQSLSNVISIVVPTGYQYVVFHFGTGNAGGSPGGWWQAWYLNGDGGTFGTPAIGGASAGGFSSARYYGTSNITVVPDGGVTVILLGSALIGLGVLRRKLPN